MSTDLSYPLVSSMGQHDPIDGYITFKELQPFSDINLERVNLKLEKLINQVNLITTDPLGIGGLLFDAYRLEQLDIKPDLKQKIINAAQKSISYCRLTHDLAFREFGLAIGLQAAKKMSLLKEHWPLVDEINDYWLLHSNWTEHLDINKVMFATSLAPDSFLLISE